MPVTDLMGPQDQWRGVAAERRQRTVAFDKLPPDFREAAQEIQAGGGIARTIA